MKEKLVLSVLVDNESGVLQRVASLFSRRAYNISSLTVSETEDPNFSRMTIETNTEGEVRIQVLVHGDAVAVDQAPAAKAGDRGESI